MLSSRVDVLEQRKLYDRMPGVSFGNLCFGFVPAFRDSNTGETHLSLNPDGSIGLVHSMESLPVDWVTEWDNEGNAVALKDTINIGFMRGHDYYTIEDLKDFLWDA